MKIDSEKPSTWLGENFKTDAQKTIPFLSKVDLLLVDHYGIDEKWEKIVRRHVRKLIVVDDLANRKHDCDVLIDSNDVNADKYKGLVPRGCIQLIGTRYFIRNEKLKKKTGPVRKIKQIIVFFGGADVQNIKRAIDKLSLEKYKKIQVHFVLGLLQENQRELKTSINKIQNFKAHIQPKNYFSILIESDLAIGSSGTAAIERCFLHVPSLILPIAENQKPNLKLLESSGCAKGFTWKNFESILDQWIINPDKAESMRKNCQFKFITNSKVSLKKTIHAALIDLKSVTESDSLFLHKLRNSERVRRVSLNQEKISFGNHQQWFSKVLKDRNYLVCVVRDMTGNKIGYVRYQILSGDVKVSISLIAGVEGSGVGSNALKLGEAKLLDYAEKNKISIKRFIADIMPENIGSIQIFKKNGFKSMDGYSYGKRVL